MIKRLLLAIIIALLLPGCGQRSKKAETVMLLHYFTGSLSQGIDELATSLNDSQTSVRLVAVPMEHEEFKINIRLQLDTDNPPDLFSYWAGARTDYLAERQKISPIDSLLESFPIDESFDKSVLDACSYKGELYMLPLTQHYVGFFYNSSVFDELGIKEPSTWDELLSSAAIIKESGRTPFSLGSANRWPAQFWFDYLILRTWGFQFREDLMAGKARYTDEEVIQVMALWKDLLDQGYFNDDNNSLTWDQAADLLKSEEAAMTLMGTWLIPYMENTEIGFFPFPPIDDSVPPVSLGPIDGALLSYNSGKKDSSAEILKELASAESQKAFNEKSGALAPHRGVGRDIYSDLQLEVIKEIERSSYWAFNYDLATVPQRAELGLDFFVDFLKKPEDYSIQLTELQEEISQF